MIPSEVLKIELPKVIAHIYYDRRLIDIDDGIKKVSGHLLSQAEIQMLVCKSFIQRWT